MLCSPSPTRTRVRRPRNPRRLRTRRSRRSRRSIRCCIRLATRPRIRQPGRFRKGFEEYLQIEAEVLPLAVENTNLKAQRLSAGSAQTAADEAFAVSMRPPDRLLRLMSHWRWQAFVADLLEMQLVQARHISEADEAAMTRMEQRVGALAGDARARLKRLGVLLQGRSDQQFEGSGIGAGPVPRGGSGDQWRSRDATRMCGHSH